MLAVNHLRPTIHDPFVLVVPFFCITFAVSCLLVITGVFRAFFSVLPFHTNASYCVTSCQNALSSMVKSSFLIFRTSDSPTSTNFKQCLQRRWQDTTTDRMQQICSAIIVPSDIMFQCLEYYRHHTFWVSPAICGICGLERNDVVEVVVSNHCNSPLDFSLHDTDPFITDVGESQYSLDPINSAMLDRERLDGDRFILQICDKCRSASYSSSIASQTNFEIPYHWQFRSIRQ